MSFKPEFSASGLGTSFAHRPIFTELEGGAMVPVSCISFLVIALCGAQYYVGLHYDLTWSVMWTKSLSQSHAKFHEETLGLISLRRRVYSLYAPHNN